MRDSYRKAVIESLPCGMGRFSLTPPTRRSLVASLNAACMQQNESCQAHRMQQLRGPEGVKNLLLNPMTLES
jgi:hypothetical protein